MKNRNIEIENRLTIVETTLREIITNHLPHIEAKVDRVQWTIALTAIGIAIDFASRLVN